MKDTIQGCEWFEDRIGKRIYRDATSCQCHDCQKIAKEGLIVRDEQHAQYLEAISNDEMIDYRDKK